MTAQHGRHIWDERKLKRLAAARADGLTMAQLAARFNCSMVTVERKLAELRASDPQFPDNSLHYLMKPPGLG